VRKNKWAYRGGGYAHGLSYPTHFQPLLDLASMFMLRMILSTALMLKVWTLLPCADCPPCTLLRDKQVLLNLGAP